MTQSMTLHAGDAAIEVDGVRHLKRGRRMPEIELPTTGRRTVRLDLLKGRAIVCFYPWTGRPGLADPPNWDDIPGAHGSTPQLEGFRNLIAGFNAVGAQVLGVSTQPTEHQREAVERLGLPFELASDAELALARSLSLPTFETGGATYLRRLTLCLNDGRIERVYHPVALPAAHAREVCAYLGMIHRSQ